MLFEQAAKIWADLLPEKHASYPVLCKQWISVLLCCYMLFTFVGCESQNAAKPSSISMQPGIADVTFALPAVPYEKALRSITDLGLQLTNVCVGGGFVRNSKVTTTWQFWRPMGQKESFVQDHGLLVAPTPLAPSNWLTELHALPGVKNVQTSFVMSCPAIVERTPPTNMPLNLTPNQAGTYLRITFVGPINDYDAVLYTVSNLGLRLADPCFEQAISKGMRPGWHVMGQENAFTATHALLVATTVVSSNQWQEQLHAIAGVKSIESPIKVTC